MLLGWREEDVRRSLWDALRDGFILKTADSYRFAHDRILQAVDAQLTSDEKASLHWRVGQLWLDNPETASSRLFELADHLREGAGLAIGPTSKNRVARVNLDAGRKAKAATAYQSSLQYFYAGLAQLGEDCWIADYELALDIHVELAEASYLSGDFAGMETFAAAVAANARIVLDRVRIYEIKMQAHAVLNQYQDGLLLGLESLRLLGVDMPANETAIGLAGTSSAIRWKQQTAATGSPTTCARRSTRSSAPACGGCCAATGAAGGGRRAACVDITDMPVTAGGDLVWRDEHASPASPPTRSPPPGCSSPTRPPPPVPPLERHPVRIAEPVLLEGYAAAADDDA